jgi:glutathione S-transferase
LARLQQSGQQRVLLFKHGEKSMKLYYAPGACSLSDHIALHEVGVSFEHERVDLKTKRTESGRDYTAINPKGYVPTLILDTGETLSENVAILDWIACQHSRLMPAGPMGRTQLLEALAYISAEIHKSFKPFFAQAGDAEKAKAGATIHKRMQYFADTMQGDFLFGAALSAADCYLFVMLLWAEKNGLEMPAKLTAFRDRMSSRSSVQAAMTHEGLI